MIPVGLPGKDCFSSPYRCFARVAQQAYFGDFYFGISIFLELQAYLCRYAGEGDGGAVSYGILYGRNRHTYCASGHQKRKCERCTDLIGQYRHQPGFGGGSFQCRLQCGAFVGYHIDFFCAGDHFQHERVIEVSGPFCKQFIFLQNFPYKYENTYFSDLFVTGIDRVACRTGNHAVERHDDDARFFFPCQIV
ncbi:hypothetical protein SDC9_149691 [bioreactor metagenome]|uniref:Uncharacterized protein n=1 Tax=bioreactor metagenome TaxID=1076179 RepID=A0A645EKB5_9ZZZZ